MPTKYFIRKGLALLLLMLTCWLPTLGHTAAAPKPLVLGNTVVSVLDGVKTATPPLANYPLQVREILAGGSTAWFASVTTDAAGQLRLNLPPARSFRLEAKNTVNNNYKVSQPLKPGEQNTFTVGTPLLQASLKDAVTNAALPNTKVTAYRIKADGTSNWHSEIATDANGQVSFRHS